MKLYKMQIVGCFLFLLLMTCIGTVFATERFFSDVAENIYQQYESLHLNTQWHIELYRAYQNARGWGSQPKSAKYLRKQGMPSKYLDHMALEYVRQAEKNIHVVILFSPACEDDRHAFEILRSAGKVIYQKPLIFTSSGMQNLFWVLYHAHSKSGAENRQNIRIRCQKMVGNQKAYRAIALLWETDSLALARQCKNRIRNVYHHRWTIHHSDTKEEAVAYAESLFNENSLAFLNRAKPRAFVRLDGHCARLTPYLRKLPLSDAYCIDTGAVLAAYGIRDCHDFDIVTRKGIQGPKGTSSHNGSRSRLGFVMDDLIYNPEEFFYHKGLRFLTLASVYEFKRRKNEPKDRRDNARIRELYPEVVVEAAKRYGY